MVGICKHDSHGNGRMKLSILHILVTFLEIFISMQTLNAASNSSLGYFCVFEDTFFLSL